jgi:hypothetical protein
MTIDIAGRKDMGRARPQERIDDDVAAVNGYARGWSVDPVRVARPTCGKERGVHVGASRFGSHAVDHAHAWGERFDALHARAGEDIDPPRSKCSLHLIGHIGVRPRQDPRTSLEQADVAAEVGQDRGELATGVRGADDNGPPGQGTEASYVLEGEGKVDAWDRWPRGPTSDCDNDAVRLPCATVGRLQVVVIEELGIAGLLDHDHALRADVVAYAPVLMGVVGDASGIGEGRSKIHIRLGTA